MENGQLREREQRRTSSGRRRISYNPGDSGSCDRLAPFSDQNTNSRRHSAVIPRILSRTSVNEIPKQDDFETLKSKRGEKYES
mgnify:CR=1 FL=1